MLSRRLTVTFAYTDEGEIPKILYLGHDADKAKAALEAARNKGYFEIRVCRDIDKIALHRYRAEPVQHA